MDLRQGLRGMQVRWVKPEGVHVTLHYLGKTPDGSIPSLCTSLGEGLQGIKPFTLNVRGFGYFGTPDNPKIIWAGIDGSPLLAQAQVAVLDVVSRFGYIAPDSNFLPHVTLGRVTSADDAGSIIAKLETYGNALFQAAPANRITLYSSELRPEGAEYKRIFEVTLTR